MWAGARAGPRVEGGACSAAGAPLKVTAACRQPRDWGPEGHAHRAHPQTRPAFCPQRMLLPTRRRAAAEPWPLLTTCPWLLSLCLQRRLRGAKPASGREARVSGTSPNCTQRTRGGTGGWACGGSRHMASVAWLLCRRTGHVYPYCPSDNIHLPCAGAATRHRAPSTSGWGRRARSGVSRHRASMARRASQPAAACQCNNSPERAQPSTLLNCEVNAFEVFLCCNFETDKEHTDENSPPFHATGQARYPRR